MANDNHLLARLSNEELIVNPDRKDWFESCLTYLAKHEKSEDLMEDTIISSASMQEDDFWPSPDDWRAVYRPYVVKDGMLQIPVFGVLLNRFSYQVGRYATGYVYLLRAMQRGLSDPNVKGIAWIHDSPGGEVAGNFELCDKIFEARGVKPMRAFSAESMYSASYSLGSSAGPIDVTKTGGVGSIGVVTAHVDYSKMMENAGVKVTFIFAGKHKVDGNPYEALAPAVKARIQKRIDRLYAVFTSTVARNRAMDEGDVRATEAATYTAEDAVEVGLADRVGVFEESLEAFARSLEAEDDEANAGENSMKTFTQAEHDKAIADARAEERASAATALTAAVAAASTEAKTRITTIMGSEVGLKRPKAAMAAAMDTDMTAEQAAAFLAKLPEEKVEAAAPEGGAGAQGKGGDPKTNGNANAFNEAMSRNAPEVGAGGEKAGNGGTGEEEGANPLLADYARAGGAVRTKKAA